MTTPQLPHAPAATLITPECEAPGCSVAGDQYTMVRCHACGGWFCSEHIAAQEGVTLVPLPPACCGAWPTMRASAWPASRDASGHALLRWCA